MPSKLENVKLHYEYQETESEFKLLLKRVRELINKRKGKK